MFAWIRTLLTRRARATRLADGVGRPVSGRTTPAVSRAARAAAHSTGEIVLRTLRLQQLAEEWRRRPSKA